MRSMAHPWTCFLWITCGKLWISASNWGFFVRLFELSLQAPPPYLAGSASEDPDGETPFETAKIADIAHTLSPSGVGIKSPPVSPASGFFLTYRPAFTEGERSNPFSPHIPSLYYYDERIIYSLYENII